MHAQRIPAAAERLTTAHACLGRAIHDLRTARGVTQQQLSAAAHANRRFIAALENGKINPPFHILLGLIHGLDVTLAELFALHERHLNAYPGWLDAAAAGGRPRGVRPSAA